MRPPGDDDPTAAVVRIDVQGGADGDGRVHVLGCQRQAGSGQVGQVIGDISAHLERPAKDAERQVVPYLGEIRVYVDSLGVAEANRREGVGTRLMQAIEQWGETAARSGSCSTPTPGARCRCRSTSADGLPTAVDCLREAARRTEVRAPLGTARGIHRSPAGVQGPWRGAEREVDPRRQEHRSR